MDERVLQARVGIMVVSAILLTAILTLLFAKSPMKFSQGKAFNVSFPSAPGVLPGTPVRKSGIAIGRVEEVSFASGSSDVLVKLRIDAGREVFENEVPRVTANLLGDTVVEFVPEKAKKKEAAPQPDGAQLQGDVSAGPLELFSSMQDQISSSLDRVGKASDEVGTLAKKMNSLLDSQDGQKLKNTLDRTESAMTAFEQAMSNINDLVKDDKTRADLKQSLASVPKLMEDTNKAVQGMQQAVARADKNLENLEHLTAPLRESGGRIVENLDSSVTRLDQFMQQLVTVTERFSGGDNQGTLSRLMNDPELYNQLLAAVRNVNELTTRMRPMLEDVRVATDKIARDPSQLGVSGVFKRSNGTKYPNYGNVPPPPLDWRDPNAAAPVEIGEPGCER